MGFFKNILCERETFNILCNFIGKFEVSCSSGTRQVLDNQFLYEVKPGAFVKFNIKMKDGYKLRLISVSLKSVNGNTKYPYYELPTHDNRETRLAFTMPNNDVDLVIISTKQDAPEEYNNKYYEEEIKMNTEQKNIVVGTFTIPDEMAQRLSELLTIQSIRERVLVQLVDDPDKYRKMEKELIPIVKEIESIKVNITRNYVPAEYNSQKYLWNYDGYDVDGNTVNIYESF